MDQALYSASWQAITIAPRRKLPCRVDQLSHSLTVKQVLNLQRTVKKDVGICKLATVAEAGLKLHRPFCEHGGNGPAASCATRHIAAMWCLRPLFPEIGQATRLVREFKRIEPYLCCFSQNVSKHEFDELEL